MGGGGGGTEALDGRVLVAADETLAPPIDDDGDSVKQGPPPRPASMGPPGPPGPPSPAGDRAVVTASPVGVEAVLMPLTFKRRGSVAPPGTIRYVADMVTKNLDCSLMLVLLPLPVMLLSTCRE